MKTTTIPGPMGPFLIPAEPENTREHAEWISNMVWEGEYSHPDLPTAGIKSVLDIGAHCGSFAVLCQHQYGKDVVIDCYEPNPHACDMLKENAPGVRIHCVAVTTDPEPLYELPWDWGSAKTFGIKTAPAYGERFKVPSIHPRDLPPADILKCDAEGVEVEVMIHYKHFDTLKALIYEFHSLEHKAFLSEIAKARGFRCLRQEEKQNYGSSIWVPV
jgi:FkbM family methyltransferase